MAGNIQSNININVTSNAVDVNYNIGNAMGGLETLINNPTEALNNLNGSLASLSIDALIALIKSGIEVTEQFENEMKQFGEAVGDGFVNSIDFIVDSLGQLKDALYDSIQTLQEFADVGAEIQEGYFTLFNYLGAEAGENIVDYTEKLEKLFGLNSDELVNSMDGILGMATNMGIAGENLEKTVKAMTMFSQDLAKFSGTSVEDIVSRLEGTISLGAISITSPLVRALNMDAEDVEAFRELNSVQERANFILAKGDAVRGTYEKWLKTAGGKAEIFKNSLSALNSNISKLALEIFAKIAPALQKFVELINNLIISITRFLGLGIEDAESNNAETYYDNIAESINSVGEASEKAERKLASFDDVIQLNDNSSKNSSMGNIMGEFDASLLDAWIKNTKEAKTEWDEFVEAVKKAIEDGRFYDAGKLIAEQLNGWLQGIGWETIKENFKTFGVDLAQFLNGLLADAELFEEIGNAFAQGTNSIFNFLYGFASNFDFKQLGIDIGTVWDSYWKNLDSSVIGSSLYEWFMGGFETLNGMIEAGSISTATDKIADIIINFFGNITNEDITLMADSVIGAIDEVFDAIGSFMDKMKEHPEIKEKILEFIKKLFTGFKDNSGEWGETLSEAIIGLLNLASEMLETADESGLSEGIKNFLDKLNVGEIFKKWISLKIDAWIIEQKATLPAKLQLVGDGIVAVLGIIVGAILGVIVGAIVLIGKAIWDLILKASELGTEIGLAIRDWWSNTVVPWFENIIKSVKDFFTNLAKDISEGWKKHVSEPFSEMWESIKGLFSAEKWKNIGKDALNGLLNGIKSIWTNIKNWWNTNVAKDITFSTPDWLGGKTVSFGIPKLAKGGIVSRSTIANIGEAGKEAVLPLENNTGWMDSLASKLANKINTSSSTGGNITIDMSGYSKNFYTRNEMMEFAEHVVEALKLYGVNIAVAY